MNLTKVILKVADASGPAAKAKMLKKYDSPQLRELVKFGVDPMITFGVREVDFSDEPAGHSDYEHNLDRLAWLLQELSRRSLQVMTGQSPSENIVKVSSTLNEDQRVMLRWILNKDFRANLGVATVNKAFPGLIPVWKMQKASDIDWNALAFPCMVQTKENGFGNNAMVINGEVTHYSNNGKKNPNMAVFDEELLKIAANLHGVFYGEVRGRGGTGKDHYKASQSYRGKNPDMSNAVFVLWDFVLVGEYKRRNCPRALSERHQRLKDMVTEFRINNDRDSYRVRPVRTWVANNKSEVEAIANKQMKKGMEGVIVKNMNSTYNFKRDKSWMKIKEKHDVDAKIVGVKQGKGKLKGTLASVTIDYNGVEVDCPAGKGLDRETLREMWKRYKKDKKTVIGRIAEVHYQNETPDGSLFLPKFVRIRDKRDK